MLCTKITTRSLPEFLLLLENGNMNSNFELKYCISKISNITIRNLSQWVEQIQLSGILQSSALENGNMIFFFF